MSELQLHEGIVTDPLSMRLDLFARRRRLHAHRLWLRGLAATRGHDEPPSRPLFVVGCPRSGTTLLFRLLRRHEVLGSPRGEGHVLWNTYHHPRRNGWSSDRVLASDIKPGERRYLYTGIRRLAGGSRFLDKTPRNILKIPYLDSLFSDATFILLKRDARATVNSLIEGWTVRHGISYRLPQPLGLEEYRGHLWSYVLPPGWRDYAHSTLAEVAALQYVACYEAALDDLVQVPEHRVIELSFEQLLASPADVMSRLLDTLGLGPSQAVMRMAGDLAAHPVQANTPPRPEKWRDRESQISRIMPIIAPTMERLGYNVGAGLTHSR
ncbi:MAG: sulfotransferase [Actinomycetota bacterium]